MRMRKGEAVLEIRDGKAVVVPKRRGEDGSKMEKTIMVSDRIEEEEETGAEVEVGGGGGGA
jgi:hypothetical protein